MMLSGISAGAPALSKEFQEEVAAVVARLRRAEARVHELEQLLDVGQAGGGAARPPSQSDADGDGEVKVADGEAHPEALRLTRVRRMAAAWQACLHARSGAIAGASEPRVCIPQGTDRRQG